eukprot:g10871.t1
MSSISGSPTLLHVDDVEGTVRFLEEAFDLRGVGSCGGEGGAEGGDGDDDYRFEMLENQSGSVQVVVLPRSADVLGGAEVGGCATLTLATDNVRRTAATAVRAGARLLRSHRVPLPTRANITGVAGGVDSATVGGAADESARAEEAQEEDADASGGCDSVLDAAAPNLESGLAWLGGAPVGVDVDEDVPNGNGNGEGEFAVRVLLVDERLLARHRSPALAPSSDDIKKNDEAAVRERVQAMESETRVGRELALKNGGGGATDTKGEASSTSSSSRSSSGQTASDKDGHTMGPEESGSSSASGSRSGAAPCGGGGGGGAMSTPLPPLLLAGLASLAESSPREIFYSCSSGLGGDASSSCASLSGDSPHPPHADADRPSEISEVSENGQLPFLAAGEANGGGGGVVASPSTATRGLGGRRGGESDHEDVGSWFTQEELLGGRIGGGGGDSGGDGSGGGGGDDEALPGALSTRGDAPTSGRAGRSEGENGKENVDMNACGHAGDDDGDHEATRVAASTSGPSAVGQSKSASSSGAGNHGDAGGAEQASGTPGVDVGGKPTPRSRPQRPPRPFRQLETFILGNDGGPLKASPNSIAPIPINNQHFEGLALLMLKREPMDKRYKHMFDGKNRMFEVQVQGKFKKPPDGELFISLEITDRMKLGLLTRGLCKLLLSFGQKMNRRLHYSFGDKDNAELPHIAFPLVTSVDSLICTPEGGEVPVLGRSFKEDKEQKARRRRGEEDRATGIGEFQTGFTYSFSFHSMYIDIAQWSTCKIPVMRDIDLHTFWGSSALRVSAYVIKSNSSNTASEASTPHLQSKLKYVFCVQVRHLSQSELGDAGAEDEEGDWDDADDMDASGTPPEAATITLPANASAEATEANKPAITTTSTATTTSAAKEQPEELATAEMEMEMEIGDEIVLPLLTDREPSPRGRQTSASRWASNDDASDDEQDDRQASRERRRRRRRGRKATPGSPTEAVVGGAGGAQGHGGNDGGGGAGDSEDEESQSSGSESVERSSVEIAAAATAGETSKDQSQDAAAAAAAEAVRPSELARATTGGPFPAWRENSGDGASSEQQAGSAAGKLNATIASPERGDGGGGGGRPVLRRGSTGVGADGGIGDDEDAMVRCPAYVDLYARSPKLQGTWTVFAVVKRGGSGRGIRKGGGEFVLRSSKNLSILPANVVPKKVHYSPRLSRQEVKRRKLDTVLQLLTASSHAHAHRSHQVIIRAVMGVESSADRAYRHYSPAPTLAPSTSTSRPTSVSTSRRKATSDSKAPPTKGGRRGSRSDSGRNHPDGDGDGDGASPSLSAGFPAEEEYDELATFSAGISVDRALSSATAGVAAAEGGGSVYGDGQGGERGAGGEEEDESYAFSPRPSLASLASHRSGGSELSSATAGTTGRRRSWASRSASLVKEGMVLRVLSEHHLSQQVAVLLPCSLTFSRPRKQCLRLLTRDIMSVELGGGIIGEDGVWSSPPESQLIPGMYLVEIHTVGRVHYMLVEGTHEARSWATAIRDTYLQRARSDGRSSPTQEDLSISDPFSQYMTKKSAWKATNFWVLNCRRALELGGTADRTEGWGGGCWIDEGGLGGQVCDFVAGLLRQALDLNDDSKPEQLITFLDDICNLRWMPLEGLSQSEQLALFLNLYHVMLLHAFFILGPPGSPLRVASYFTTLCYEVGGDVLSMADLEHCVLRAKMSQPKQFLSKLIIPTTEYPFSLRQPEPRVSFALNCGSVSGVPGILIYRPESVYEQLDDASTYYVQRTSEVLVGKRTVILPKIISWYSDDFSGKAEESNGSISWSLACLLQVKRHFTGEKRRQIDGLLVEGGSVSVKFESWNWKCRPVTLVSESELATLRSHGEA